MLKLFAKTPKDARVDVDFVSVECSGREAIQLELNISDLVKWSPSYPLISPTNHESLLPSSVKYLPDLGWISDRSGERANRRFSRTANALVLFINSLNCEIDERYNDYHHELTHLPRSGEVFPTGCVLVLVIVAAPESFVGSKLEEKVTCCVRKSIAKGYEWHVAPITSDDKTSAYHVDAYKVCCC
jgi:hypothetical protein